MPKLSDLSLDDNPISHDKVSYSQIIIGLCNSLETLDSIAMQTLRGDL